MKGQVAFEIIMYSMIATLLVISVVSVLNYTYIRQSQDRATEELASVGRNIQREVIIASEVKAGYTRIFNIPPTILQYDINISNSEYEFVLSTNSKSLYWQIPFVTGNFTTGKNTLKNNGSVVIING